MKKLLLALFGIGFGAALFAAPPPPHHPRPHRVPPPPPPPPAHVIHRTGATTPDGWYDDFAAAQREAVRTNRPILLLLTGSDWCPHCVRLKQDVLNTHEFRRFARERLILVYADFPNETKLPHGLRQQNEGLARRFGVRGFPTTIILSPHGRELGRIGGNAPGYLSRVMDFVR